MAAISTRDVGLRLEIMWCTIFLRLNPNDKEPTYVIVTYADSVSLQSVRLEGNTSRIDMSVFNCPPYICLEPTTRNCMRIAYA